MAYVPLYGRIADNQGGFAHSLCMRGRVDRIAFWLNSWFGEVISLSARLIDGRQMVAKPDLRTVRKADRESVRAEYEGEVKKQNRIVLDIDIPTNEVFLVRINGIAFSNERLKAMNEERLREMDEKIVSLQKLTERNLFAARKVMYS